MAKIQYVGKKQTKTDNVANTETVWNGPGDIQEVTDASACSKLIAHPNIWRLAAGEKAILPAKAEKELDAQTVKAQKLAALKKEEAEALEQERLASRVNVNTMPKEALIAHAKRTYGLDLDGSKKVEVLRAQVVRVAGKKSIGNRAR